MVFMNNTHIRGIHDRIMSTSLRKMGSLPWPNNPVDERYTVAPAY